MPPRGKNKRRAARTATRGSHLSAARIRDLHAQLKQETNAVRSAVRFRYAEGLGEFGEPAANAIINFFAALWVMRRGRYRDAEQRRSEIAECCYWAEAAEQLDAATAAAREALAGDLEWAPMVLAAMWQQEKLRLPTAQQSEANGAVFDQETAQLLKTG